LRRPVDFFETLGDRIDDHDRIGLAFKELVILFFTFAQFALGVAVGTIWEIFEFLIDRFFGLNMQKSGLVDTMTDLMINAAGSLVAAAIGYYYVRDHDSLLGRRVIRRLIERYRSEIAD